MHSAIKGYLSEYLQSKSVKIYDTIFTLHSQWTVVILLTCSFLLSAKQYFGEPIQCITEEKNAAYVNTYCWTMGTYIVQLRNNSVLEKHIAMLDNFQGNHHSKNYTHSLAIAEGVGPENPKQTERVYLRYYQWMILLLFFQAFIFYTPAFLWKRWEGERLQQLCEKSGDPILDEKAYASSYRMLVKYFTEDYKDIHFIYAVEYFSCEMLNFIISIVNIICLDVFLNGFWSKYVHAIASIPHNNWKIWNRITSQVFPKVAKCELVLGGPSGSNNVYNNLCMLPLNILNEKMFVFLWFWFLIMTVLAGLKILYRCVLILCPKFRLLLLRSRLHSLPMLHVDSAMGEASFGEWFIMYKVSANINPALFKDVMRELSRANFQKDLNKKVAELLDN